MSEEAIVTQAKSIYFNFMKEYINGLDLPPTSYELNEKHIEAKAKMMRWYADNSNAKSSTDILNRECMQSLQVFHKQNRQRKQRTLINAVLGI